jgi:hypothetical protein
MKRWKKKNRRKIKFKRNNNKENLNDAYFQGFVVIKTSLESLNGDNMLSTMLVAKRVAGMLLLKKLFRIKPQASSPLFFGLVRFSNTDPLLVHYSSTHCFKSRPDPID